MIDFTYETAGIKLRATQPEVMGSLIELDLGSLDKTADGTYLVTTKSLQSMGDWALGVDALQAKKAGKSAPEKGTAPRPSEILEILNSISQKVPPLLEQFRQSRQTNPIEKGIHAATAVIMEEITRELIEGDPRLKERLREIAQESIDASMEQENGEEDDEEEAGA